MAPLGVAQRGHERGIQVAPDLRRRGELLDVRGGGRTLLPVVIANNVMVAGDQQQVRSPERVTHAAICIDWLDSH